MQHFLRDGKAYWGGLHRELGLLLYDPRDQQRLAADKVRLYGVCLSKGGRPGDDITIREA